MRSTEGDTRSPERWLHSIEGCIRGWLNRMAAGGGESRPDRYTRGSDVLPLARSSPSAARGTQRSAQGRAGRIAYAESTLLYTSLVLIGGMSSCCCCCRAE